MRWLLVFVVTFVVFNGLARWLERIGLGRLPGDFRIRVGGRDWFFPLGSTIVLSLIAAAVSLLL